MSTTDSNGTWSDSGIFAVGDTGAHTQTWYVGGIALNPELSFSVQAQPTPTVELSNPAYPGISNFVVGESSSWQVTGEPGTPVVLVAQQTTFAGSVINSTVTLGLLNSQGSYQFQGTWGPGDQGAWSATQYGIRAVAQGKGAAGFIGGALGLSDTSAQGRISTGLTVAGFIPGLSQVAAGLSVSFDIFKTAQAVGKCN